jgi:CRP-like cAMP-binding protein
MEALTLLLKHPFFEKIGREELLPLAKRSEVGRFIRGDKILTTGSPQKSIYVFIEGLVEVTRRNRQTQTRMLIGLMQAPGVFGDAEALSGRTDWGLTVVAKEKVSAVVIPKEHYLPFVASQPELATRLYVDAASRLMLCLELMQLFALQRVQDQVFRLLFSKSLPGKNSQTRVVTKVSPTQLARSLGLSVRTVQRNLTLLEKEGRLKRTDPKMALLTGRPDNFPSEGIESQNIPSQWRLPPG